MGAATAVLERVWTEMGEVRGVAEGGVLGGAVGSPWEGGWKVGRKVACRRPHLKWRWSPPQLLRWGPRAGFRGLG